MDDTTQYQESELDPVFRAVVTNWAQKIQQAKDRKRTVFGEDAEQCQRFFDGAKDWNELMGKGSSMSSGDEFNLSFKVSVNKAFEFVTIFGPAMYFENPVRTAKPRMPVLIPPNFFPDPMMYQAAMMQEDQRIKADGLRGVLLQAMLNWSPNDFDLSGHARQAIDEALIKGRGCLWTELYKSPSAAIRAVRSSFDSVDALLIDPDATSMDDAKWIARRVVSARWEVERQYGLRPGSLRSYCEQGQDSSSAGSPEDWNYEGRRGLTNDLIVTYKIYSKMGIGGRLQGADCDVEKYLDVFGNYCHICISPGVPFLLNLPPEVANDPAQNRDTIFDRTNWPIPFWEVGGWPVTCLDFHKKAKQVWPVPHLKAGIAELKFLNWVTSFLMGKLRTTLRDIIVGPKSIGEEMLNQILHGNDLAWVPVENTDGTHLKMNEIVQILQFPAVNGDAWKMIEFIEQQFDKRVGLTELMYGSSGATQIRSAQEAEVRNQNMSVRPDDMAKQVESWMSDVAAKEAMALRWLITGQDVSPMIGPVAAMAWDQFVSTKDLGTAAHQLEYRVESGSTKRPNRTTQIQQITQAFQSLSPIFTQYGTATGDMGPLNNLVADYTEAQDLDPGRFQMRALPMMPQAPADGEGGPDEGEPDGGPPAQ